MGVPASAHPTNFAIAKELARVHSGIRVPVLVVTHDLGEDAVLADRMVVLGHGRTLQAAPPRALIDRPCSWKGARLVGQRNLFRGLVRGPSPDRASILLIEWASRLLEVESNLDLAPGTQVDWIIPAASILWQRPDRPVPGNLENPVVGRVLDLLPLGDNCAVTFVADGPEERRLFLSLPAHAARRLKPGNGVRGRVSLLAERIHLLKPETEQG